eukprot:TRINITY_DN20102_c0_g1_i1.p1 TRINITY_DN20102_c0_g1~~TRINITY_DN20102_c0_g1_i1.p1  ORF type:complete len:123 (+),score=7.10 TRINITY_DN20102_c0_g1_i1:81-449(+)
MQICLTNMRREQQGSASERSQNHQPCKGIPGDGTSHSFSSPASSQVKYVWVPNGMSQTKTIHRRRKKPNTVCQHCQTSETPEWRRGPLGQRTLCNACGLLYASRVKAAKRGRDAGSITFVLN